uniref:SHOCT domain-containing protein n=1 Tax=Haptolina brevifila TaxID=156173 RepID=A0A7S2IH08_9EUKA|mmetsp:Transcript_65910/g.130697  ORF Transcript_65910/g.130697 Transcript_65910/m.130697 type:complete len:151 (+) Transcript_65910:71-523(+)
MDANVRAALTNLKGMLDEGFVSQGEYNERRKAILDKATGVQTKAEAATGRTSVFDRLRPSEPSTARSGASRSADEEGKWSHDGFDSLYGGGSSNRQQKRAVTVVGSKTKGGAKSQQDLRAKLTGRIQKGDLREKLGQGRRGTKLPEQCPW